jgi:alanine dehydrogenase
VPLHPDDLSHIRPDLLQRLIFERGYGVDFNCPDDSLLARGTHLATRDELFRICDLLILPKPTTADLSYMSAGQTLWGWQHCVQNPDFVQVAIDRRLTLIAWEAMYITNTRASRPTHVFYANNELAGAAAVHHTLDLVRIPARCGSLGKVVIIGYGSVSRGAINAFLKRGYADIHVYTRRPLCMLDRCLPGIAYHHIDIHHPDGDIIAHDDAGPRPLVAALQEANIICNGILQDLTHPLMFLTNHTAHTLHPSTTLIDISCDKGLGFPFARPTTFREPIVTVAHGLRYYAVDHTPNYFWRSASRAISNAALPYLDAIAAGPSAWHAHDTIRDAIDIQDGVIRNPNILSFQRRHPHYPHSFLSAPITTRKKAASDELA